MNEEIKQQIEIVKTTMEKHTDQISKYDKYFEAEGLVENKIRVTVENLSVSEKAAFQKYDGLKENRDKLQAQLRALEANLASVPENVASSRLMNRGNTNART